MTTTYPFNVRVYGIVISGKKVLVTDELIHGMEITKFPGGGLEFGEGTLECIQREMKEETGQEAEVIRHFYTTDFFQPSAFNPHSQVISIYYLLRFREAPRFAAKEERFDFGQRAEGMHVFRWVPLEKLSPDDLTFPIDKKVAGMIRQEKSLLT